MTSLPNRLSSRDTLESMKSPQQEAGRGANMSSAQPASAPSTDAVSQQSAAPGAAQMAVISVAMVDVEDQKKAGSPTPSQPGDGPGDDALPYRCELPDLEEPPYFQPYWSPPFFVTAIGALIVIWAFCWLYVGAFWNPTTRLTNLHMTVLDCDMVPPASSLNATFAPLLPSLVPAPLASGMLAATVWNQSSLVSKTLHWKRASCPRAGKGGRCGSVAEEAACVAALSDDVRQGESWGLLYFSSNFTGSYLSWYPRSGITPLYQQPVAQYVYARGRDYSTYTYLGAIILSNLMPGLSRSVTTALASNPQIMSLLSPVFLATGISVQGVDLAPVRNFGQHFASYIFCVLMWLGSSFVVVSSYQFKLPAESALLDPRTKRQGQSISPAAKPSDGSGGGESAAPASNGITVRWSELAWELLIKALIASLLMFVLMVLLCAVLWALGGGNEQWYYNPGYAIAFGWYMSWSFIYINAVLLHVIGIERFSSMTALLLILQLTSASGILSVELSNRFFYIGKGLPFFYGVRGFRTIFFGTMEDKMWINWLVFTAYNVVFAPLSLALVSHRLWTAPSRARKAGVGEVAMPIVIGFA